MKSTKSKLIYIFIIILSVILFASAWIKNSKGGFDLNIASNNNKFCENNLYNYVAWVEHGKPSTDDKFVSNFNSNIYIKNVCTNRVTKLTDNSSNAAYKLNGGFLNGGFSPDNKILDYWIFEGGINYMSQSDSESKVNLESKGLKIPVANSNRKIFEPVEKTFVGKKVTFEEYKKILNNANPKPIIFPGFTVDKITISKSERFVPYPIVTNQNVGEGFGPYNFYIFDKDTQRTISMGVSDFISWLGNMILIESFPNISSDRFDFTYAIFNPITKSTTKLNEIPKTALFEKLVGNNIIFSDYPNFIFLTDLNTKKVTKIDLKTSVISDFENIKTVGFYDNFVYFTVLSKDLKKGYFGKLYRTNLINLKTDFVQDIIGEIKDIDLTAQIAFGYNYDSSIGMFSDNDRLLVFYNLRNNSYITLPANASYYWNN